MIASRFLRQTTCTKAEAIVVLAVSKQLVLPITPFSLLRCLWLDDVPPGRARELDLYLGVPTNQMLYPVTCNVGSRGQGL